MNFLLLILLCLFYNKTLILLVESIPPAKLDKLYFHQMYLFVTISFFITNILFTITSVVPLFPKVKRNALLRNSSGNYLPLLNNKENLSASKISIQIRENVN